LVQPSEEGRVLESLLDEGVHLLLKRQVHPDADALHPLACLRRPGTSLAACIRPGPPPVMMSQFMALRAEHIC
jgi:hypothetical protein